jgi:hypothetical protein
MRRNSITPSRAFFVLPRARQNLRRLAVGPGPAILHRVGAGGHGLRGAFQLDQTHPAIARDGQPLVEAEARDLRARRLAGLEQRVLRRNIDLGAVDDDLGHAWVSGSNSG